MTYGFIELRDVFAFCLLVAMQREAFLLLGGGPDWNVGNLSRLAGL
jgi:hypothetical protein